jgi:hypothetical protein
VIFKSSHTQPQRVQAMSVNSSTIGRDMAFNHSQPARTNNKKGPDSPGPNTGQRNCRSTCKETVASQAEKLLPQPQDFTAFGFLNVKPRRERSV